ncbi:hypothetical protein B566_EDAN018685 [Ephemera danica]|nr:hypothetical protein B566_EDAN018685 [Ephemera danica]
MWPIMPEVQTPLHSSVLEHMLQLPGLTADIIVQLEKQKLARQLPTSLPTTSQQQQRKASITTGVVDRSPASEDEGSSTSSPLVSMQAIPTSLFNDLNDSQLLEKVNKINNGIPGMKFVLSIVNNI